MVRCVCWGSRSAILAGLLLCWISAGGVARAQVAAPDSSVGAALHSLASRADVAFAGRVTAVRRLPGTGGSTGVVAVDFAVEQTLLGSVGSTYTLREWGGLWSAGQHRYWVGERVAMFLHAAGRAGLSSPVDGMEGVLPIVQVSADSEPLLDLRRVATRVLRAQGAPIADAENNAMPLTALRTVIAARGAPFRLEPVRLPLPVGVVTPRIASPVQAMPGPVLAPLQDPVRSGPVAAQDAEEIQQLLHPIDPERAAVGESVWSSR